MSARAIPLLYRVCASAKAGAINRDDAREFCEAVERFDAGAPLNECMGVAVEPGQRTWRTRRKLAVRDGLVCELRRRRFAEKSPSFAGEKIAKGMSDYAGRGWKRHRKEPQCPHSKYSDQWFFWRVLKLQQEIHPDGFATPLGCTTIRGILRNELSASSAYSLTDVNLNPPDAVDAADSEN